MTMPARLDRAAARLRTGRVGHGLLAVLVLNVPLAAGAAEPLGVLLDRVAPSRAPQGSVEVMGWIERAGDGPELVVTLAPKGEAKLVADPGITVTPRPRAGVTWGSEVPVSRVEPGGDYFRTPQELRIPFAGEDGRPVEAAVEYAYCLVGFQCLFGEATVSAMTRPQG